MTFVTAAFALPSLIEKDPFPPTSVVICVGVFPRQCRHQQRHHMWQELQITSRGRGGGGGDVCVEQSALVQNPVPIKGDTKGAVVAPTTVSVDDVVLVSFSVPLLDPDSSARTLDGYSDPPH